MLSNPPYGKSWKTDLERMGGKTGMRDHAVPDRPRRRSRVFARDAIKRRSDAVPRQQALEDEDAHAAGQPYCGGTQRQFTVHGGRGPGREQHSALDHRERLARSHGRPAREHVLQHRHRDLRLGAHEPQARAPAGQGAVDRRHEPLPALAQEPGQEELRTRRGGHRPHLQDVPANSRESEERQVSSTTQLSATGR